MPIKKLPKEVASKIAAGEVVERPVSVIKELIENAIDAQATEITINIEQVGRKLIEVADNGAGIEKTDIALALQRYATSKIESAKDLEQIKSLGFRGEALASISAVSRFAIESRTADAEVGYAVESEGGEEGTIREVGKQMGTRVVVKDLFFNVPARLKFLKSDATERRQINRLISRYALRYPDIKFSLNQDGKKVFSSYGDGKQVEILTEMFGLDQAKQLLPVQYVDEYLVVTGFTSPHSLTRASRGDIFFFVNGRLISDAALSSAVTKAYQGMIMVGRFPISFLFIEMDPHELDVNVHPTKTEIRLKDASRVFTAVYRAVKKTILAYSPVPAFSGQVWAKSPSGGEFENEQAFTTPQNLFTTTKSEISGVGWDRDMATGPAPTIPLLRLIGQLGQTYLAAEGPDGLYLIDQHAAHERVLFEQLMDRENVNQSQYLLEPCVLSLEGSRAEDIEKSVSIARELGFKIEDFGPGTYKIIAIPQILSGYDPETALLSLVEEDDEDSPENLLESERMELVVKRICKRLAVKGGQRLSDTEQDQLIRDLERCSNPRTCPHGRPVIIHISVDALERRFGRTGSV